MENHYTSAQIEVLSFYIRKVKNSTCLNLEYRGKLATGID